jgi:hypothetical protein
MMPKRRPNYRLVKRLRSYTTDEASRLLQVHKNTVRAWIRHGLPVCDQKRPILILGTDLASFLQARRASRKRPCRLGELYCFRCRAPRVPAGQMADYEAITETVGNLTGICPTCESMMNQRVSLAKVELIRSKLDVKFSQGRRRLGESNQPSVNSDLEKETQ